jgi:hypothetical protein
MGRLSKVRGQHEREWHGLQEPALSGVEGCRWERALIIRDEGAATADDWPNPFCVGSYLRYLC